jgi:hypothetical protein
MSNLTPEEWMIREVDFLRSLCKKKDARIKELEDELINQIEDASITFYRWSLPKMFLWFWITLIRGSWTVHFDLGNISVNGEKPGTRRGQDPAL